MRSCEHVEEGVDSPRIADVDAGPPRVRDVDAEADVRAVDPVAVEGIRDRRELLDVRPDAATPTRGVLEDEPGLRRRRTRPLEDPADPLDEPGDPDVRTGPTMRPDVDVHERGAEARSRIELGHEHRHRPFEGHGIRTGQVHEIRRVDRHGSDIERFGALAERRQLGRWGAPTTPGGRVVREDLHRARADRVRPVDSLDHPRREWQVRADAPTVGQHPAVSAAGRRSCRARACTRLPRSARSSRGCRRYAHRGWPPARSRR